MSTDIPARLRYLASYLTRGGDPAAAAAELSELADQVAETHGTAGGIVTTGLPDDVLGRLVRGAWTRWAREQPDPKPSWLVPWDDLDEGQREVDIRIGRAVARAERLWCAQLAEQEADRGRKSRRGRIALRAFAQRLRDRP